MSGRHDAGLAAGLLAAGRSGLAVPSRELAMTARRLAVADRGHRHHRRHDRHAAIPCWSIWATRPSWPTVTIAGELALTVQVALRAAATGYQVLVCTRRPQRWQQVTGAGLQVVGRGGLAEQLPPSPRRWLVVYDDVCRASAGRGRRSRCARWPDGRPAAPTSISSKTVPAPRVIRTWAFQYRLRIDLDYERRLTDAGPRRAA